MSRYGKRDDLRVHEQEPFNAETARPSLRDPVTATDAFYVRRHGSVPDADAREWSLRVHGLVERELGLSLETLREALPERQIVATLQHELQVRAWDSSAASQPSNEAGLWNPKGYVNNATPRLHFRATS